MSVKFPFVCLASLFLIVSCNSRKPLADPKLILKDGTSFWAYKQKYVSFYEDYKALDEQLKPVKKGTFLNQLSTGKWLPLRLRSDDTTALYQLYKLPAGTDKEVRALIQQWASTEADHFLAEGQPLPDYHFVDMEGRVYSRETTRGKILVLKCWFVHCTACVAEMPDLNALKQRYKNRDDILFISLCLDSRDKVETFLKRTKFDFATVADQSNYMENVLKIQSYPMHFVVDKKGLITKKVSNYEGVAYALNQLL